MDAFYQITDDGFPGAKSLDFIGQRIVYVEPFGRYWGWSDLVDGSSWNTLNQAQAETSPDRIQGLIVSHNEVLIFGERTIEPWASAPTDTAVFQLQVGSVIECGCASGKTIQRLDNSVFFLTNNGQIARLNGYTPLVVSTAAMEASIRGLNWSRAFAFTWEDAGHVVYYITFPDGMTWGFDVRQNKWHRRESYGLDRWRINALAKSNGKWIAGDYSSGRVYELEFGNVYEACEIMPRKFRSGVFHNASNRVRVDGFRIVAATGQPPIMPVDSVGPAPDPAILLVTGTSLTTGGFAKAQAAALPDFTEILAATGADLDGASAEWHDGTFLAVGDGSTRYAGNLMDAWTTGTLSFPTHGGDLLAGGPDGWVTQSTVRIFGDGYAKAPLVPTAFSAYSVTRMLTTPYSPGVVDWFSMLRYTGGYYYADQDGTLMRSATLSNTNWEVLGNYRPDGITWFHDVIDVAGEIYVTCQQGAVEPDVQHQIRKWNGTSFDILLDIPYGGLVPWQLESGNGVLLAYCWGGENVYTSADNFAEPHATGIASARAVELWEEDKGRQIEFADGLFHLISGDNGDPDLADKCVTTANGITFNEPVSLPITNLKSITSNSDPAEEPPIGFDTCTPMEGGVFQLRYSNDGAENWSNYRDAEPPRTGWFLQPLVWRRLGMARHRVWEILDTSNRPQDVLAAEIIAQ